MVRAATFPRRLLVAALLTASLVAAGCSAQQWTFSLKAPGERVHAFLLDCYGLRFRGLPQPAQVDALTVHLSPILISRLKRAYDGQQAYARRFPGDKPPLIEGDLFSSLFEGPTSYAIAEVVPDGERARVLVKFTFTDPATGQVVRTWNDRYLVVRGPRVGGWLVEDVEYLGDWDFASKGKLSEALEYAATYD
jgi:hypothetical protein